MNRLRAALVIVLTAVAPAGAQNARPLVIGETFDLRSRVMGEVRRINVYSPSIYLDSTTTHLPVLYMPDGGIAEDFLHIAGLVQVSVANGTMRPFLLVGIENTERRRDMTGPTTVESDRSIAPRVGGSSRFRAFMRDELMPYIKEHYPVTDESAIMGESLAGLFVVETFLLEPELFDTYIAFDPSLWWDNGRLVREVGDRIRRRNPIQNTIYLAHSAQPDIATLTRQFAETFKNIPGQGVTLHFQPLPNEQHATIYHPAALLAFRSLFKPAQRDSTR